MLEMCELASKLSQDSIFLEYPNLDCFYLVIRIGLTYLNYSFGLPQTYVTYRGQLTSTLKQFWSHRGAKKFKNIPWIRDISHTH